MLKMNIKPSLFCFLGGVVFFLFAVFSMAEPLTPTPTITNTQVLTPAVTPSYTFTFTPTPSFTPVVTSTSTPTMTITSTGTLQPTFTPTLSETWTPTVTPTPTMTITFTPTYTSTPGVFKFTVSPKPDGEGKIRFSWGTTIPAEEIFLKIYTTGMRVVREFYFNRKDNSDMLTAGIHEISWDGRDENNRPMPPANYLCFIDVKVALKKYEASGKTEIP